MKCTPLGHTYKPNEDEKLVQTLFVSGQNRETTILSESYPANIAGQVIHCKSTNTVAIHDGIKGNPNMTIIPERDVYRLWPRTWRKYWGMQILPGLLGIIASQQ